MAVPAQFIVLFLDTLAGVFVHSAVPYLPLDMMLMTVAMSATSTEPSSHHRAGGLGQLLNARCRPAYNELSIAIILHDGAVAAGIKAVA